MTNNQEDNMTDNQAYPGDRGDHDGRFPIADHPVAHHRDLPPDDVPEYVPLAGLPRARALLGKIESLTTPEIIPGMSAHAQAIATVELASATQLAALLDAIRLAPRIVQGDEEIELVNRARGMLGFPPLDASDVRVL